MDKEVEKRKELIEYCRLIYDRGFLPGIDGNVSVRVDEDTVLVTPTGISKRTVTENELVYIKVEGQIISGNNSPSSETPMHLEAYRQRKEVGAVIHAHSCSIGAFAFAGKTLDTRSAPFAHFHIGTVGEVPYITPGSPALHKKVREAYESGCRALILMNHGSIVLGSNLKDAYQRLDMLEAYARMLLDAQILGGAKLLTGEELREITGG